MKMVRVYGDDIYDTIFDCVKTDKQLYKIDHHSNTGTVEGCADYTITTINEDVKNFGEILFFRIIHKGRLAGFIGLNKKPINILRTWMINPEFRNYKTTKLFFTFIESIFKGDYSAYIWEDNIKAKRFLVRNGGKIEYDNEITKLNFSICQLQQQ